MAFTLEQIIDKVIFLDIETVSSNKEFSELSERMQLLWKKKSLKFNSSYKKVPDISEVYTDKAAIQSEFGKIICISTGFLTRDPESNLYLKTKSYYGHDEKKLLNDFCEMLSIFFEKDRFGEYRKICTHNGKEFDIPYIGRRIMINKIKLPELLDIKGKKPWDIKFILDTQELWSFGDIKASTSLDLLAAIFDIPTPKDDINGADVGKVYYKENNLERIKIYCEKDILTTARVFLELNQIDSKQITSSDQITIL